MPKLLQSQNLAACNIGMSGKKQLNYSLISFYDEIEKSFVKIGSQTVISYSFRVFSVEISLSKQKTLFSRMFSDKFSKDGLIYMEMA